MYTSFLHTGYIEMNLFSMAYKQLILQRERGEKALSGNVMTVVLKKFLILPTAENESVTHAE